MLGQLIVQPIRRLLGRRRRPQPGLEAGERVLLHEMSPFGACYVATDRALYYGCSPGTDWRRLGWPDIRSVDRWTGARLRLTLSDGRPVLLSTDDRSRLPALAAELVAACHLMTRRITLPSGGTAVVRATRAHHRAAVVWTIDASCTAHEAAAVLAEMRSLSGT
ncbi:hypothetical protein ABZS66_49770 [Dactylosporangium sp. NPDC005572]|uniref:hypothetical protein n=1 Tax=Dactylosporangium sp. NPDC005572 TaxID=3156889 RepID=UPI0033A67837